MVQIPLLVCAGRSRGDAGSNNDMFPDETDELRRQGLNVEDEEDDEEGEELFGDQMAE